MRAAGTIFTASGLWPPGILARLSPSTASAMPSSAMSLIRNCPAPFSAGKPPKLCSQTGEGEQHR